MCDVHFMKVLHCIDDLLEDQLCFFLIKISIRLTLNVLIERVAAPILHNKINLNEERFTVLNVYMI